jgi:hypothetical protein
MTKQKLNLIEFAAGHVAQARAGPSEIVWSELSMSARTAADLTTSQSTFGVIPSPQIRPVLLIARKIAPCVMPAAVVHVRSSP